MHSPISLMSFCYCFKENLSLCLYTPSKKSNKGSNDEHGSEAGARGRARSDPPLLS